MVESQVCDTGQGSWSLNLARVTAALEVRVGEAAASAFARGRVVPAAVPA